MLTIDTDDFLDEAPTAVLIRALVDDEPEGEVIFEAADLDPASFVPMATRYPQD